MYFYTESGLNYLVVAVSDACGRNEVLTSKCNFYLSVKVTFQCWNFI